MYALFLVKKQFYGKNCLYLTARSLYQYSSFLSLYCLILDNIQFHYYELLDFYNFIMIAFGFIMYIEGSFALAKTFKRPFIISNLRIVSVASLF